MNFIDLFAGAGGLSEGFLKEGYNPIAHVEMNQDACFTLKTRLAFHYLRNNNKLDIYKNYLHGEIDRLELYSYIPNEILESVINTEISPETISNLFEKIDILRENKDIDLIIGGPPCQAYSIAGRARLRVTRENPKEDTRNYLFRHYIKFLEKYSPKAFIFENVPGLVSAGSGLYLEEMYKAFTSLGYNVNIDLQQAKSLKRVDILDTSHFGVLQKRNRVIVVGVKQDISFDFLSTLNKHQIDVSNYNVKQDLLEDLPYLNPNDSIKIAYYSKEKTAYQTISNLRSDDFNFTSQHVARPHNNRDLEIYYIAIEKWLNDRTRLRYDELPERLKTHKNQKSFLNRFCVIDPIGCSHTVVAHISSDGHYYIYPDLKQVRSISIREAARIQSFSDDYFFEGSRTSAFKQIGNAVPPVFAQQLAKTLKVI